MDTKQEQLKIKEQWLREEIRAVRGLTFTVIQWGVTLMAAISSSLYFLRKDVTEHLVALGNIKPGELMPWPRWFFGSLFLVFLAFIFSGLVQYLTVKVVSYREQLIAMNPSYSGIFEKQPADTKWRMSPYVLFYAFPLIDQLLYWGFFSAAKSLRVPW